jgi:hypothetical protein
MAADSPPRVPQGGRSADRRAPPTLASRSSPAATSSIQRRQRWSPPSRKWSKAGSGGIGHGLSLVGVLERARRMRRARALHEERASELGVSDVRSGPVHVRSLTVLVLDASSSGATDGGVHGGPPYSRSRGGRDHRRLAGVDGGDDLGVVDALQIDAAPRGAMRKERTGRTLSSVSAGMPTSGRCSGPEKLGAARARDRALRGEASRRCDGRAVLPDARARASETERQSESEPVMEAPRLQNRPETWRTGVVHSNDAALVYGGSLRVWLIYRGAVDGGRLRVPAGWAVGVQPAANPVDRIMVNVGDAPRAPGRWRRPGKARCRLTGAGRVGVRVVVRAGESPVHGEGGQQGRGVRRRSGGRA